MDKLLMLINELREKTISLKNERGEINLAIDVLENELGTIEEDMTKIETSIENEKERLKTYLDMPSWIKKERKRCIPILIGGAPLSFIFISFFSGTVSHFLGLVNNLNFNVIIPSALILDFIATYFTYNKAVKLKENEIFGISQAESEKDIGEKEKQLEDMKGKHEEISNKEAELKDKRYDIGVEIDNNIIKITELEGKRESARQRVIDYLLEVQLELEDTPDIEEIPFVLKK